MIFVKYCFPSRKYYIIFSFLKIDLSFVKKIGSLCSILQPDGNISSVKLRIVDELFQRIHLPLVVKVVDNGYYFVFNGILVIARIPVNFDFIRYRSSKIHI